MARQIEVFRDRLPLVASCRVHPVEGLMPEHLIAAAENLSPETSGVGVLATDHPRIREMLKDLADTGTRVVTIASDIPSIQRAANVEVDNVAAGRVAGLLMGRLVPRDRTGICVFMGSRRYRGHEERDLGFRSILQEEFPALQISGAVEVFDARSEGRDMACRVLKSTPDLAGIYCVGGGRAGVAEALTQAGRQDDLVFICHDQTSEMRQYLLDGTVDAVIDQNAVLVADQSVIALLGSIVSLVPSLMRKFIEPRIIFKENIPVQGV
ncbi:substrate-binding domain-containing protein [Fluviibacterium sp. DFM31]|uniref:Substrate-binding domain-containing protein n=1 Tax=Meridianimarinicoccus marinus TaxID=3231483 RepID=A0ABV3L5P7_9RHOB